MDASTPGARPPSPDALQIPLWLMAIDPPCVRWRNAAAERLPPLELPEAARLGAWYRDCLDRGPQMLDWPYAGGPARVRIAALNEAEGGPALLVEGLVAPAAARLARTLLAFGHATVPLSVFDGDGWLLAHSPAARAHFGSGAGNLYELFMRAQDRADCQTALIHGEVWINELPLRTVDGERWHEVRVTRRDDPVEGGELLLFEARDIETLRSLRLRLDPLLDTEHALFERSGIGLALLRRGRIVRASRRLGALLGTTPARLLGRPAAALLADPGERRRLAHELGLALANGGEYHAELRLRRADGSHFWCTLSASALAGGTICFVEDIAERRAAAERLAQALDEQRTLIDNALAGIVFLRERRVVRCNRRFADLLGYRPEDLTGVSSRLWFPSDAAWAALGRESAPLLAAGGGYRAEAMLVRRDGTPLWCELGGAALDPADPGRGTIWIVLDASERHAAELALAEVHRELEARVAARTQALNRAVQDLHVEIEERRQAEARARHLAHHDALTGLPNRALFGERLERAIAAHLAGQTAPGARIALLFLDLDRFKTINDTLGHGYGDELLRSLARRLPVCVREQDTVARLGGDEFVVLLNGIEDPQAAAQVAERILASVCEPMRIGGHELQVTPSIGISLYPDDGQDAATLMKHADLAMYEAKSQGRNGYRHYAPRLNRQAGTRLRLAGELRHALARDEFVLFCQPRARLADGAVTGLEALLRWRHPQLGTLRPAAFLGAAEELGLVPELLDWLLDATCRQSAAWLQAGLPVTTVAVSLPAQRYRLPALAPRVQQALEASALAPKHLELQIDERLLAAQPVEIDALARRLDAIGVRLALDGFGIGRANLDCLVRLPLARVTLPPRFVRALNASAPATHAIVRASVAIARELGLGTLAEGVEQRGQLDVLKAAGCEEYQGGLLARPMDAGRFEAWLKARG